MSSIRTIASFAPTIGLSLLLIATGCGGSPSTANIELRKEKQALAARVAELETKSAADQRVIESLRDSRPTIPTLPPDRLARLFTTTGLELGRLTGGLDTDGKKTGDEGVKVYIAPIDNEGQPIKMSGSFTVEAFDLADTASPLVGTWAFDVASVRKKWRGSFLDYNYVLDCPWQEKVPTHDELTLKITFVDELTQAPFKIQTVVKVKLPTAPTTQPTTAPATKTGG
ncbi:prefoldin domain-containing protein [Humisphaera borealis]|uniref:Lipoprotein n=1 Tax=Humisphaera borealis TaxID=2807512 RepID=A0A7M2WU19_9BACT|nr:hypothetical protein [Humisphaera borealis]QOV89017.1 hypothetical protein IPV69_22775 [Humisphaera borealis]